MISAGYEIGDCAAAECDPEEGRLTEVRSRLLGYAQAIERIGGQADDFLRRTTGGLNQVGGGSTDNSKSPVASSHFHRIDAACERLEQALKFLDARVQKLSEIG